MDGLDCNETLLSSVGSVTDYYRLEAEYYTAKTVKYPKTLKGKEILSSIQYGTSKYCDEDSCGYPVLRLNELNNGFIEKPQKYCHIMSAGEFESLRLHKGDVVVIRTNGNPNLVGRCAVILEDTNVAFASYLYRVVPNEKIYAEVLVAYLNCKYGRYEIDKNSMKGNQTNFSPAKFKDIAIPDFGKALQDSIRQATGQAYEIRKAANRILGESSHILSAHLNIDIAFSSGISKKAMSESFLNTGRLDAEYYQLKYEVITRKLNTKETVSSLCNLYDKNYVPVSKKSYQYIELADVGQYGDISDVDVQAGIDLPTRARRIVKTGQIIVSSVEGSLQSCALITDEYDGALCSTGFYVLDSNYINSETLLVLFKSEPIQALMKQRCSGTILTAISKDELLSMPLPMIDEDVQKVIAAKVQESFALRKRSKQLLEYAKQAVEMAIEQGEDTALEWLKDKVE